MILNRLSMASRTPLRMHMASLMARNSLLQQNRLTHQQNSHQTQLDDDSNNDFMATNKWAKHSLPDKSLPPPPAPEPAKPMKRRRRQLKPLKSVITLTPNAILHLKQLMQQPDPKLIRISVRNRGCSGLSYHLEYVSHPEKFDEQVEQDGVKVLIDSKALFSIIGSEMDWIDDKLSSKFVFKNPNSKGSCGCGESFMV
ncbi:hypothetical protein KL921_000067 [Ogataea angusta]|uniref:Iron-sulfur assembly protein 1 n=1 Tax=Pichia angusta TaxID=870730 RepID=A0AAN6DK33_PICAN|nr:uncharacterized protein KL928_000725 [Ogataea angusta]KAG7813793.1 hypothetical protein KL921_000067 [Ogataea angusta]KAG7822250.1 hypothetical protein KL928_000725 [Ogataea angusta]KAG7825476.1 hypothetical protein KL909_000708 [Ogataea angusta]KAG7831598.1 hypothetical protein KL920_001118 [Ogataea angusta]KAG7832374.1 hypothetical protein KL943_005032 [Ogataea angusta]